MIGEGRGVPWLLLVTVGTASGFLVVAGLTLVSVSISAAQGHVGLVPPWLIVLFAGVFGIVLGLLASLVAAAGYALVARRNSTSTVPRAVGVAIPAVAIGALVYALATPRGPQDAYGFAVAAVPGLALFAAILISRHGKTGADTSGE